MFSVEQFTSPGLAPDSMTRIDFTGAGAIHGATMFNTRKQHKSYGPTAGPHGAITPSLSVSVWQSLDTETGKFACTGTFLALTATIRPSSYKTMRVESLLGVSNVSRPESRMALRKPRPSVPSSGPNFFSSQRTWSSWLSGGVPTGLRRNVIRKQRRFASS